MKYLRILMACAAEPWAIDREKLRAVIDFLAFQAVGGKYDDTDVEARISGKRAGEVTKMNGTVAILPVYGVLAQRMNMLEASSGGTSVEQLQQAFRAILADDQVKAVILNFDSPGGNVNGIEEFAQEIYDARGIKPIVAQIDSLAASAAYWLASAADEIVVTPSGAGGSIGVFAIHEEISAALERAGVKRTLISSSGAKHDINSFTPLSESGRAEIQERVDHSAAMFMRAVARGRGVTQAAVKEQFGDGRMFNADQMLKRGMADRIAPLKATLERFGVNVSPARRAGANAARAALAAGQMPSKPDLEDLLREQGSPRSLATIIAGRGATETRSESGEATNEPAIAKEITSQFSGFSLPKF